MITCFITYTIDPTKIKAFERYGETWINLVNEYGGQHLGYFLPHEGANTLAYALFNFPSLSAYEQYRSESLNDPNCQKAYQMAEESGCILSYDRSFLRPLKSFQSA